MGRGRLRSDAALFRCAGFRLAPGQSTGDASRFPRDPLWAQGTAGPAPWGSPGLPRGLAPGPSSMERFTWLGWRKMPDRRTALLAQASHEQFLLAGTLGKMGGSLCRLVRVGEDCCLPCASSVIPA